MTNEPNFNRIARLYRWAEYLTMGTLLQRTRNHFLPQVSGCHQALVLGDGDGRFLARLLAQNSQLNALAVDLSSSMLQLLRRRCPLKVQTLQTSAVTVEIPPATDLIVTHFFLDCLTQAEVDALSLRLAQTVAPGTLWLLSDFRIPYSGFVRPFAAAYVRFLYFAFAILTGLRVTHLPDPQAALSRAGFHRVAEHRLLAGILYTEIWQRS